jgi:hypothetical protein
MSDESWNPYYEPTGSYNMGRMIPATHDTGVVRWFSRHTLTMAADPPEVPT